MAYLAMCTDQHPDAAAIRQAKLAEHLDYIEGLGPQLLVAGPLNLEQFRHFDGSLFIYDVDNEAAARDLLESDPYWIAGLYGSPTIAKFLPARGCWA